MISIYISSLISINKLLKGLRGKDMYGIKVNFYGDNDVQIGGIYLGNKISGINAPGTDSLQVESPKSLG